MKKIKVKNKGVLITLFAGLLFIIGVLLCFSIIGIFPGLGCCIIAYMLLSAKIECPNCKHVDTELNGTKTFKCPKCSEVRIIEWVK